MRQFGKPDRPMRTKQSKIELDRSLRERLQALPPADWVCEMIRHYQRTGSYRARDLRRLLGDPTKGVEVGPEASLFVFAPWPAGLHFLTTSGRKKTPLESHRCPSGR